MKSCTDYDVRYAQYVLPWWGVTGKRVFEEYILSLHVTEKERGFNSYFHFELIDVSLLWHWIFVLCSGLDALCMRESSSFHWFQVDEQSKREETQSETMAIEEPAVTTETSPSSEVYTTVVESESDFNHGDNLYVSRTSENTSITEQAVSLPQSTYNVNISVSTAKLSFSNLISKDIFSFVSQGIFLTGCNWSGKRLSIFLLSKLSWPYLFTNPSWLSGNVPYLVYIFFPFKERCLWEAIEEKATGRRWGTGWIWWIRSRGSIRGRKWTRPR